MCVPLGLFDFIWILVVLLMAVAVAGVWCYKFMIGVVGKSKTAAQRKQYRPGQPIRRKINWDKQEPT